LSSILGDKAQSLGGIPKLTGLGALVARLKARIEYLNDEGTSGAANQNCPEFRQHRSLGAAAITLLSQSSPAPALSELEAQVLRSLLAGKQSSHIAEEVKGGAVAVKEHIKSMLRKVRGR
jgi:DNA-binding NarL/FixJ family response regulator